MNRRPVGALEALAECYDFDLEIPSKPCEKNDRLHDFHNLVTEELRQYHIPHAEERDRYLLGCTLAVAEANILSNTIGPVDNLFNIPQQVT